MIKKIFLLIAFGILFSLFFLNNSNAIKIKGCPINTPVCGIDGLTYENSCLAGDVKILHKGECKTPNPKICTADYRPVCGVDGVTYSNSCMAGDVKIAHEGACKGPFPIDMLDEDFLPFNIKFPSPISNENEFLEKYGKICSSATDGVNILMMQNGEIVGTTLVGTPEGFKPSYMCTHFKGLEMTDELKIKFNTSVKNLPKSYKMKVQSALNKFYSKNKDFVKQVETTQKLVKKVDELYLKVRSKEAKYLLDYIKFQVINLFQTKK